MPWVRIDDGFAQHPKVVKAGPLAMAMQVAALCYCNRNLTNGFVPRSVAKTLIDWEMVTGETVWTLGRTSGHAGDDITPDWVIGVMLDVGMWEVAEGGYNVHDYDQYQPSKEEVLKQQAETHEAKVRAGKAGAEKRWQTNSNNHSRPIADGMAEPKQTDGPVPDPVPDPNTDPVPMRPKGRGGKAAAAPSVSDDIKERMVQKYADVWGRDDVLSKIADALGHPAAKKRTDHEAYVNNWLLKDATPIRERRNGRTANTGPAGGAVNANRPVDPGLAQKQAWLDRNVIHVRQG